MKQKSDHPEKKFVELNAEIKQAKDHMKKLQARKLEDEKLMLVHHEQMIFLEEKYRKMHL